MKYLCEDKLFIFVRSICFVWEYDSTENIYILRFVYKICFI